MYLSIYRQQAIKEYIGEPINQGSTHKLKNRNKSQEYGAYTVYDSTSDIGHTSTKIRFDPIGKDVRQHQFRDRDASKDINPEMKFGLSMFKNNKSDANGIRKENHVGTYYISPMRSNRLE